jgi:hypothetical protein
VVFSRDTALATALAHANEEPAAPSTRSEFQIPSALNALILDCLAKDPAARPATASVLAERLAGTVPADAWPSDAARAWWERHAAALAATPQGTEPARAQEKTAVRRRWDR